MRINTRHTPESIAKMRLVHRRRMPAKDQSSRWKGGIKQVRGYRYLLTQSQDISAGMTNIYRGEHRLIAERALGRSLKRSEVVHHIDGNQSNNRNDNLLICTRRYHNWLEGRMAYLYKQEYFLKKYDGEAKG